MIEKKEPVNKPVPFSVFVLKSDRIIILYSKKNGL